MGRKPHQLGTVKLSNNPQVIDQVRDAVGLSLKLLRRDRGRSR